MRTILTLLLIMLVPMASYATPDRQTAVDETLLGYNNSHAFILRTVTDNHGSYYTTQSDMVLIARRLDTGADDQQWPVISIFDRGAEFGNEDGPRVENLGAVDRVNPFDVLLWRKASGLMQQPMPLELYDITLTPETLTIGSDFRDTTTTDLGTANAQIATSLQMTASALPPQERHATAGTWEDYLFLEYILNDICQITQVQRLFTQDDYSGQRLAVKRSCDGGGGPPIATYIIVPGAE